MLEVQNSVRLISEQGFTVARLANAQVEVAVIPALGAKLFSLRSLATGREWLWRPPGPTRLFANQLGDAFTDGTLIGADECLPTIGACNVAGRALPDHGEAWSAAWTLDEAACARGEIVTSLRLPRSPFTITRTVRLDDSSVLLDYELRNHASTRQPFLWALHPLLTLVEGDRLYLPDEVRQVRVEVARDPDAARGTRWEWPRPAPGVDLQALTLASDEAFAKFFAGPLPTGAARIENVNTGDRLEFRWSAAEHPFVGVWLTRGGWRGAHHPALEPTNAACDALTDALREPTPALFVAAGETRRWQVVIDLSPRPD
jgi:galactose mutarotase-like enzyme